MRSLIFLHLRRDSLCPAERASLRVPPVPQHTAGDCRERMEYTPAQNWLQQELPAADYAVPPADTSSSSHPA